MSAAAPRPRQAPDQKLRAAEWFASLRDRLCQEFEAIEDEYVAASGSGTAGRFEQKRWQRPGETAANGGGGVISLMKGNVFEKVGVNVSTVHGEFTEEYRKAMPGADTDPRFWASGISVVAHMRSPKVPAAHMNTRHIVTTMSWFGGGGDLTPMVPSPSDTSLFHDAFRRACDRHDPLYYKRFSEWCDRYFYLPHRKEPRGVGGIFYDQLSTGDWERDFAFTRDVGLAFVESYPEIVRRHMFETWTDEEREHQLIRRGRYVEFNLLYDRGTVFGLKTGGNPEAILMSLPPEARWP